MNWKGFLYAIQTSPLQLQIEQISFRKLAIKSVRGCILKMQTKLEKRDRELENLLGNLLITEYQAEKLKERITKHLGTFGSNQSKVSENIFKYSDNWYRIVVKVDQVDLDDKLVHYSDG
jgi:hypothetical protein